MDICLVKSYDEGLEFAYQLARPLGTPPGPQKTGAAKTPRL